MYRVIIEFKDELTNEKKMELKNIVINAFNNRIGNSYIPSDEIGKCTCESSTEAVIALGILQLDEISGIKKLLKRWDWEDTEYPNENCSVIEEIEEYENKQRKNKY